MSSRSTVAFVCLARGLGGSTRSLATVFRHLEPGVRRVLVGPSDGPFLNYVADRDLIEDHVAIPARKHGKPRRATRFAAAARVLAWTIRHRHEVRALHANGPEEFNIAAPASVFTRIPVVVWSHAREVSPWMRRLAPVWRRLLRRVRWAAVSTAAADVLVQAGFARPADVEVIPNPIDPGDVTAPMPEEAASSRPVVGYLGSDAAYKGFHLLPDVIDRLRDLPVEWRIFSERGKGNPATWTRLRSLPDGIVSFPGKLREVSRAYAQCDIVFCPSLEESFGRVVAEAMVNGIPVVASDLPAVREVVGGGDAALLFPPGDTDTAADAIRRLVADPDLRSLLARRGRDLSRDFDPERVVSRLSVLYGLRSPEK